ncbi:NADH-quinone oxidoreductase subunit NuoK [Actinospica sp. MGRD01-02]|uniref:NADH-quinone oxidoreductase subunit K n=1 Tax=Actinospica acidithermotolerans TaxID=2828514 RepID=A0A941EAG7_9ACTN|nr:NADH-quinone oxidoreductase subunit NuoK [Actinospica acidithermotolerans]MBR7829220.1 NADH-quinone oxidoreductase subunit NuoK [Actinospica acidithermotolerans]
MHAVYPLVLGALLFAIGLYGVLARRNAIAVLMAIELLLNAVTLNLVSFSAILRDRYGMGQIFTLFIITIAAAETGLGLAIVLLVYRQRATADLGEQRALAEPVEPVTADELSPRNVEAEVAR